MGGPGGRHASARSYQPTFERARPLRRGPRAGGGAAHGGNVQKTWHSLGLPIAFYAKLGHRPLWRGNVIGNRAPADGLAVPEKKAE
jgi:hypothetical protein